MTEMVQLLVNIFLASFSTDPNVQKTVLHSFLLSHSRHRPWFSFSTVQLNPTMSQVNTPPRSNNNKLAVSNFYFYAITCESSQYSILWLTIQVLIVCFLLRRFQSSRLKDLREEKCVVTNRDERERFTSCPPTDTYRRMGPLMVPAKLFSSILVKYVFLWRSLDRKVQI